MNDELDSADFDAMIGCYNIGNLDRQQEIWGCNAEGIRRTPNGRIRSRSWARRSSRQVPKTSPNFVKALLELEDGDPYNRDEEEDDAI
jgi:hypothetical protein